MAPGRGMARPEPARCATLFVYGTLMRTSGLPLARKLVNQSIFLGLGWISARLYSLGSYPGAVRSKEPRDKVYGEAVRLLSPAMSLAWLDRYEGCLQGGLEPQAYERVILPVTLKSGGQLNAWVYVYNLPVSGARRLPDGRFMPG